MAMTKINFINGSQPAINDTNLNALQANVDNAKQDKMKEGIWTPILTTLEDIAPTMTYIIQRGKYKKIGNMVYISVYIRGNITALNGSENYAKITGLPYRAKNYMAENNLNVGTLYQMLENDTNANVLILDDIMRVQIQYGETAGKLKVTPTGGIGYFEISASGWYETI